MELMGKKWKVIINNIKNGATVFKNSNDNKRVIKLNELEVLALSGKMQVMQEGNLLISEHRTDIAIEYILELKGEVL